MEMNKEVRNIDNELSEIRAIGNSRLIEGYGIIFNKESKVIEGRFKEIILPEAVDGIIDSSDVLALLNHNEDRGILARSKYGIGSMKLMVDNRGLKYSFLAPNTNLGDELIESIKRGDISTSSFSFTVNPQHIKMERRADGSVLRTIKKFEAIYDVSPVYREAYSDTTVALRNLDEFTQTEEVEQIKLDAEVPIAETIENVLVEEIKVKPEISYAKYDEQINNHKN